MLIDCDTCRARGLGCGNCLMSLLVGEADTCAELDDSEAAAFVALAAGGLLPPLRFVAGDHRPIPLSTDDVGVTREAAAAMTSAVLKPAGGR